MTDYTKLVEALRDEDNCNVLSYIDDAADAIEALQFELDCVNDNERWAAERSET